MTSGALLIVIAAVVGVQDGRMAIDRGVLDGLRWGDRGTVFYELSVGGESRRVDVTEAEIVELDHEEGLVAVPPDTEIKSIYRVWFRLPAGRLSWRSILRTAESPAEREALLAGLMRRDLPADPTEARALLMSAVAGLGADPSAPAGTGESSGPASSSAAASDDPGADATITVPAGAFPIGLDSPRAQRFNQEPNFTLYLEGFTIDQSPATATRGLTWDLAAAWCQARGMRLPTEFEWEAASRLPGFRLGAGLYEWTSSPYRPYPGNTHPEDAYTRDVKTLRGDLVPDTLTPHRRRYLAPDATNDQVAARCAK